MGRTRGTDPGVDGAARLLARLAVLAAVGSLVVLLLALGDGGLEVVLAGLLGIVLCAVGLWWFVAHRGAVRLLGALLAVAAPVGVVVLYAYDGLWLTALLLVLVLGRGPGLRAGGAAQIESGAVDARGRGVPPGATGPDHEPEVRRREGRPLRPRRAGGGARSAGDPARPLRPRRRRRTGPRGRGRRRGPARRRGRRRHPGAGRGGGRRARPAVPRGLRRNPQPLRHGPGPRPHRPVPLPRRADRRRGAPDRPRRRRRPGLRQHRVLRGVRRRRATPRVPRRQGGHDPHPHAGPAARRGRAAAGRADRRHAALRPAGPARQQQPVRLARRVQRRRSSPASTTASWGCSGSGWRTRRRPPTWPSGAPSPRP
ncbi:hypothetical protein STANM309S_01387 [Streptomyces tanashiensis]